MKTRTERDSLGELEVPEEVYYGVQTARAVANFQISPWRFGFEFIRSMAWIKAAAARTNRELGLLDELKANTIEKVALAVVWPADHSMVRAGASSDVSPRKRTRLVARPSSPP